MTDTTEPPPTDPMDDEFLLALQQLQRVVTDHHVAILKLQNAVACFPCPEGRTTADVGGAPDAAAPASAKLLTLPEAPQPLDVGECVEYGICNCAAGPATTPLKLGQPDPVP